MEFLNRLQSFIEEHSLFQKHEKVLLAVSGGIDSVVLFDSLLKLGYSIAIAHCNFQLRNIESDEDENFITQLAQKSTTPFFCKKFNTKQSSEESHLSIQMAARELRFDWFEELRIAHHFDCIAIAHHLNDVLETVLLNLVRGTGIAGFHGILPLNGKIVRPLLFASRQEIETYAKENKLSWREDSSNSSNKYARNLIRNKVVPLLKTINPSLEKTISQTVEKIRTAEIQLLAAIEIQKQALIQKQSEHFKLNIQSILAEASPIYILYSILKEYGFEYEICKQILESADGISGKTFFSASHILIKDRESWLINKKDESTIHFLITKETTHLELGNGRFLKIKVSDKTPELVKNLISRKVLFLDFDKIPFPLKIRTWENGDILEPFGMSGSKKISDLLIDSKKSLAEKKQSLVIESIEKIISLLGLRNSRHYLVDEMTSRIWVAELSTMN